MLNNSIRYGLKIYALADATSFAHQKSKMRVYVGKQPTG